MGDFALYAELVNEEVKPLEEEACTLVDVFRININRTVI